MIEILYGIIIITLLFSSLMVIIAPNSIHSVLFLILSYISASSVLLILKCEFLALILITIYVGAVAVLFLFVVLLLDIKLYQGNARLFLYSYSIFLSLVCLVEILTLACQNFRVNPYFDKIWVVNSHPNLIFKLDMLSDIEVLGQILSVNFVVQLLTAGLILFLGIVGSIVISINFNFKKAKLQIFYRQFAKSFKNSLVFSVFPSEDFFAFHLSSEDIPAVLMVISGIALMLFLFSFASSLWCITYYRVNLVLLIFLQGVFLWKEKHLFDNAFILYLVFCVLSFVCLGFLYSSFFKNSKEKKLNRLNGTEKDLLVFCTILFSILLYSEDDFCTIFCSIEFVSVTLYVQACERDPLYSIESGLKFFFLGAGSAAYFLVGWGIYDITIGLIVPLEVVVNFYDSLWLITETPFLGIWDTFLPNANTLKVAKKVIPSTMEGATFFGPSAFLPILLTGGESLAIVLLLFFNNDVSMVLSTAEPVTPGHLAEATQGVPGLECNKVLTWCDWQNYTAIRKNCVPSELYSDEVLIYSEDDSLGGEVLKFDDALRGLENFCHSLGFKNWAQEISEYREKCFVIASLTDSFGFISLKSCVKAIGEAIIGKAEYPRHLQTTRFGIEPIDTRYDLNELGKIGREAMKTLDQLEADMARLYNYNSQQKFQNFCRIHNAKESVRFTFHLAEYFPRPGDRWWLLPQTRDYHVLNAQLEDMQQIHDKDIPELIKYYEANLTGHNPLKAKRLKAVWLMMDLFLEAKVDYNRQMVRDFFAVRKEFDGKPHIEDCSILLESMPFFTPETLTVLKISGLSLYALVCVFGTFLLFC